MTKKSGAGTTRWGGSGGSGGSGGYGVGRGLCPNAHVSEAKRRSWHRVLSSAPTYLDSVCRDDILELVRAADALAETEAQRDAAQQALVVEARTNTQLGVLLMNSCAQACDALRVEKGEVELELEEVRGALVSVVSTLLTARDALDCLMGDTDTGDDYSKEAVAMRAIASVLEHPEVAKAMTSAVAKAMEDTSSGGDEA